MSTAAGQKFLNENLHRTAVLASHIPSMSPRKSQKALAGRAGGGGANASFAGDVSMASLAGVPQPPQPPTTFPLYVRIRAVVSDWSVPKEQRGEFVILGAADSVVPEEPGDDWNKTRQAGDQPDGSVNAGGVVGGVLEQILREIMQESDFNEIVDNMVKQETPLFAQFEDSPPPGQPSISQLRFPDAEAEAGTGDLLTDLLGPEAAAAGAILPSGQSPACWRSDMLLDFPCTYGGASSSSSTAGAATASASKARALDVTTASLASNPASPSSPPEETAEDVSKRYWDDSLQQYGEVDLDAFKLAAGEVLDSLLLDVMDDVVAGRMNWMRPLPRGRRR